MKKSLLILTAMTLLLTGVFVQNANAQTTKTVGTTGADYATLKSAFDAINVGTVTGGITGAITLQIIDNTSEAATAVLNASGGIVSYTSVKIYPTLTGLSISGNIGTSPIGTPLIDLNGADNVTIDGRVNETGAADLIISNTSPVNTAGTSTIRFINDASSNTIQYCNLKGSSTAAASGVLFFSTTTGTTGNDGNTISYNNITNAGSRPLNVIYSQGTSLKENSGNTISNNNFYDFLHFTVASYGIQLQNYTSSTNISGNSFYETSPFVPTGSAAHTIILIGGLTTNTSISLNYIGGSAASCGGTAWTKTNAFNNAFVAISAASATSCSIQGNIIRNFSYANSLAASWTGISVGTSTAIIGTTAGNIIGNGTGTGSIALAGGATGTAFYGISISGAGNVSAENNVIGSVTVSNVSTLDGNFYGIYNAGSGSNSIRNNTIGSLATANSINASSASTGNAQAVYGIYSAAGNATISGNSIANLTNGTTNATAATAGVINGILVAGGSNIVSYNIVHDLTIANANNLATNQASVGGIVCTVTAAAQSITGNTIYNLFNTNASFAGSIIGLYFNGSATANTVSGNFIYSLSANASSTGNLFGIKINAGATTYSNNIINVGDNNTSTVYGIFEAGASGTTNLYFNTVYIGGSPTSGTLPSYGLYNAATTNIRNIRNNILSNARFNNGATGAHYAISLAGTTGLTADYNDYFTSGTGGVLGSIAAVDKVTLADWQTATTQDATSLNTDPLFTLAGGFLPANYVPAAPLPGVAGTGVLVDFNESARTSNSMGALESAAMIPSVDVYSGVTLLASYANIVSAFNAINNGTHTGNLIVKINGNQNLTVPAVLKASGVGSANYLSVLIYPTVTGLSILGDLAIPLIDLDGADNVTFDGRVNATGTAKDLIINNVNSSNAATTSTIRFMNDASNNTVQYCVIKGAETSTTSGILLFNGTNGTAGNDNNLIDNNNITSSTDATRPVNAVYSEGQATAGLENSGNIINANNIYDFLNRAIASSGIHLFARSIDWTISGNSFYETTTFAPTVAVGSYNVINIRVAGTFNILDNFIGGNAPGCVGTWTKTGLNAFGNNTFYAIACNPGINSSTYPVQCNIQGNTIKNFTYSNSGTAAWYGMYFGGASNITGSILNIGTTSPNTIGAATGNGSITYTGGATGANFYGIRIETTGASYYFLTTNIQNNFIGSITVANSAVTPGATHFFGIYKSSASGQSEVANFTNNTIGSIDAGTTNSINATSLSTLAAQTVYGIVNTGAANHIFNITGNTISKLNNATTGSLNGLVQGISIPTATLGKFNISNNTVRDLTIANANSTAVLTASVIGIGLSSSTATAQTIKGNTVYNLSNTSGASTSSIFGIYFAGGNTLSDISNNFIHSFSSNPLNISAPYFYGIRSAGGVATLSNNIVSLGGNSITNIYGMYSTSAASAHNIYFNTVHIGGTAPSGTATSYGIFSTATAAGVRNIRNNIFDNTRSTIGGTAVHNAAAILAGGTIICDYNDYVASGTGGVTTGLPIVVAGQDVNSVGVSPGFTLPGGTAALNYYPSALLPGVAGTGILTDYFGNTRNATTPTMGALNSYSGNLTVGPTGTFPSLTNALQVLQAYGFTGGAVILELQAAYLSSVETFPISFTSALLTSATNSLTIRPELGATGLVISNGGALAHTIDMNGANYITIDGRPGGVGTASELTITSDLAGSYLYNTIMLASSSNNAFRYCNITNSNTPQSGSPYAPGATIWFAANANPLFHNYNNTIDNCSIHGVSNDAAGIANTLLNILSSPNTIITNNNLYDYGTKTNGVSYALMIGSCDGSTISGNSFYQTGPREVKYGSYVINLNGGNNYTVSGNYIGGSAPLCAGTATTMTFNSFASATWNPIVANVGTTLATNIQGNTISNIQATFNERGFITFFSQGMGKVNYGTATPNIIGSLTDINSISVINSAPSNEGSVTGLSTSSATASGPQDETNFSNNVICGISMSSTNGNGIPFTGINAGAFSAPNLVITNNTVGSNLLANAITNSTPGKTIGINGNGRNLNTITGNIVANITQSNTGTTNQLIGINAVANPGLFNVTGNTIHDLTSASSSAGIGMDASVIGILAGSYNTAGQNFSGNTIHSLSNTSVASAPSVIGLYYLGPGGSNNISGNYIYGMSLASSSQASSITGIYADASQWNSGSVAAFSNNMIQLGFNAAAQDLSTGYSLKGIYDCKGSNSFYNNSVYVGGTGVTGITSNTYAFSSDVITNTRAVQNNIFENARSGGATGQHYAISLAGITVNPAGLTCSHNLYFTTGVNGMLGRYNSADHSTLAAWQAAVGQDNGSIFADPSFVNPTGGTSPFNPLNLHITNPTPTPVEGAGTLISFVTTDFDGEIRSSLTPNDIGADAGNFIATPDLTAPSIAFVPIASTPLTTSMVLTGFATITDNKAVSSGLNTPRIYYKKLTDANAFVGNTSADNGWKYTLATNTTSPYDFTIDYSLITGGVVNPGDVIQYFLVAQDDANNLSSNFNGATSGSVTDPIQSINACPPEVSINTYFVINNTISGTITVPGNYSTLTGPSGLFQTINEGTVNGNILVQITDNLIEPGTFALNQFAAPYTLTISPGSASLKTITANIDNGLIRFFGADRVNIDGRFAGSGKYLEFYNSGSASYLASTFLFTNMANNNTIQYVNIKGQNPGGSIVKFEGIYPNTGNSSGNIIDRCDISGTGSVGSMISSYSNVGGANTLNSITNCNLFDFYHPTNSATAINLNYGSSDWTITGNSFYQTTAHSSAGGLGVIQITDGTNHLISNNYIGGSAPLAGGTPWTSSVGNYVRIIYCFNNAGPYNMDITNNTITNMNITSTSANGWYGIDISSAIGAVSGNTIGSTSAANAIVINGTSFAGIEKIGTAAMNIENNNIGGISATTGVYGIITSGDAVTNINNNTIGSTTISNSINAVTGQITGISAMHNAICSFSGNSVANLTSASGAVKGMVLSTSGLNFNTPFTVDRNIIRNLTSGSAVSGVGNASSVLGLAYSSTGNGGNIRQNEIHDLANSSTTGAVTVTGMFLSSSSGSVTVARNAIYGLSLATNDITAGITGIHVKGVYSSQLYSSYINANIQNNILRLGDGINTGYAFTGILDEIGITSLYFNSLVLSGGDAGNTAAKSSTYTIRSLHSNTRNFQDNILVNNRVGGTTGVNYVLEVAGTAPNPAGLTLNYNDYWFDATFGAVGFYNGATVPTLAAWQTAVGKDVNSISADPLFTSATNLIPLTGSLVIGAGTPIGGITTDFAGTTRLVPHTMGAYESAICINPTAAGSIATDQNGCSPFDPLQINGTVVPSGVNTIEYKWQYAIASFTTWNDIANSNLDSYDPGAITATTMYRRLVRVTCKADWEGAAVSNPVTMTVNPNLPVSVTVSTPATTVCATTMVTFTATPINPGANPLYQWKLNGNDIPGANAPTYSYIPANLNQISCVLTSDATPCATGSPAPSNTITMNVNPVTPVSISILEVINPGPVCQGTSKTFFAMVTNAGLTPIYHWKVNGAPAPVPPGSNENNFTYVPANGDLVNCELTSSLNCPGVNPATSNTFTMVVNPTLTPTITIGTTNTNVCTGGSLIFTAVVTNGGLNPTYIWKVNGAPVGTNSPLFTYTPVNYTVQTNVVITCELTSASPCAPANPVPSNQVNITVNPLPALNPITGEAISCAGTMAVAYGVTTDNSATASYAWSYSGLGATLSATTGSAITINFASDATSGTLTVVETITATGCSTTNTQVITINQCFKTLNLTLFLEGLYIGGGMMNAAMDGNTGLPKWGATIADHITVELHDAANYLSVIYTANDVPLNTDGTLSLTIPAIYNGNYYIAIKHRNSIETVIANPILFNTPTVSYNMSDLATKAFGSNLKAMTGAYVVYAGEVSSLSGVYPSTPLQDAIIDLSDSYYIYSSYLNGDFGYVTGDLNGDGIIDLVDAYMSYSNYLLGIYSITP